MALRWIKIRLSYQGEPMTGESYFWLNPRENLKDLIDYISDRGTYGIKYEILDNEEVPETEINRQRIRLETSIFRAEQDISFFKEQLEEFNAVHKS